MRSFLLSCFFRNKEYIHDRFDIPEKQLTFIFRLYNQTEYQVEWLIWPASHRHNYLQQQSDAKEGPWRHIWTDQFFFFFFFKSKQSKWVTQIKATQECFLRGGKFFFRGERKEKKNILNYNNAWKEARRFSQGQENIGDVTWVPSDMGGTTVMQIFEWHRQKYFTRRWSRCLPVVELKLILDHSKPKWHLLSENTPSWWVVLL